MKRLLTITLVVLLALFSPSFAAYEDFTTFDATNDEGNDITVDSATKVSWVNLATRNETGYVYKDYTVNHFNSDHDHLFEMLADNGSAASPVIHYMLATHIGDRVDIEGAGGDSVWINNSGTTNQLIYILLTEAGLLLPMIIGEAQLLLLSILFRQHEIEMEEQTTPGSLWLISGLAHMLVCLKTH